MIFKMVYINLNKVDNQKKNKIIICICDFILKIYIFKYLILFLFKKLKF